MNYQVWVNLIASPTMRANMTKRDLGEIQSKLFPKFGTVSYCSSGIALAANMLMSKPTCFWLST